MSTPLIAAAVEVGHDLADRERIPMWVIYDHPADWPEGYIGRLHYSLPEPTPTLLYATADDPEELREAFRGAGYTKVDRSPGDDPPIMESWVL